MNEQIEVWDARFGVLLRIAAALERIADTLDSEHEGAAYSRALDNWKAGFGKHPDD